jgi:hypothetical protein
VARRKALRGRSFVADAAERIATLLPRAFRRAATPHGSRGNHPQNSGSMSRENAEAWLVEETWLFEEAWLFEYADQSLAKRSIVCCVMSGLVPGIHAHNYAMYVLASRYAGTCPRIANSCRSRRRQ